MFDFKSIKYFLLIIFYLLLIKSTYAQKPSIEWQKSYGGSLYDKAKSIIQTKDGGYAIGGHSESSNFDVSANIGGFDFWIIKTNDTGQIEWKKTLGGTGFDYVQQIIETPDEGFLCIGYTNSTDHDITNPRGLGDFLAAKLDFAGNLLWSKNFGGSYDDWGYSACLSNDGNYILCGSEASIDKDITSNHGDIDFWVIKIDPNGNIIWQKTYGGYGIDFSSYIIKTSDGGYAITGYSNSQSDDFIHNKGGTDIWLLKIDSNGVIQWSNNFGGTLDDTPRALIEDTEGNFLIVGETYSFNLDAIENHNGVWTRDYIAIKTTNLGQKIWSRCYGGNSEEYARGVVQTFDGEYAIVGESYSVNGDPTGNHGSAEYWLIKIDPANGNIRWEKNMGGTGHDEATAMAATFDNGYVLVGNSAPPISDDVTLNRGFDDIWVVKLKSTECHKNLTLSIDVPLGSSEFKALENITSTSKLLNNSTNVLYLGGKSIVLSPGFKIEEGVKFEAKIENCN
jgi:hypothetical protein